MAFWIVYQGTSWQRARAGGYLWAPKIGKNGQTPTHWSNMALVRPGDLIFSGVNGALRAISQPAAPAYDSFRPDPLDEEHWQGSGWRLDVAYTDLPRPLPYDEWVPTLLPEMQAKHAAFSSGGRPNQGYLFALPNSVGERLAELVRAEFGFDLAEASASAAAPSPSPAADTERERLAKARIGQGQFRKDLLQRWNGKCPASSVTRPELLRASHIKPWSSSNNAERLDPCNGVLLSAAYDAAFDALLISFRDDGRIILASDFPADAATDAGINPQAAIGHLQAGVWPYMAAHRELMRARVARNAAAKM